MVCPYEVERCICRVHDQSIWAQGPCPHVWFRAYNQVHSHIGSISAAAVLKGVFVENEILLYESAQCSTEHLFFSTET